MWPYLCLICLGSAIVGTSLLRWGVITWQARAAIRRWAAASNGVILRIHGDVAFVNNGSVKEALLEAFLRPTRYYFVSIRSEGGVESAHYLAAGFVPFLGIFHRLDDVKEL